MNLPLGGSSFGFLLLLNPNIFLFLLLYLLILLLELGNFFFHEFNFIQLFQLCTGKPFRVGYSVIDQISGSQKMHHIVLFMQVCLVKRRVPLPVFEIKELLCDFVRHSLLEECEQD